jgi:hypothetical protein
MSKMKNLLNARHMEHAEHQDGSIARKGSVPKRSNDGVALHPSATRMQKDAAGLGGMGHATATIDGGEAIAASAAAAPLAHGYGGAPDLKTGKGVAPVAGHRSRTNQDTESHADKCKAGADTLAQAVKC